ncbi:hypothetical protein GA707_17320 [Nostocoides sp. F2B08]|uniref:hypothetical protein n=1 Tax=Nostocoides sp. F2B08 TaxID=2653936 RepID=UPI0012630374|nr:hypothetical protein [Tetrasphaera sp. F2B08]KAB7741953.1 hypothetical protein GA707_17320 [Tetrasphaera sp. F2B08]
MSDDGPTDERSALAWIMSGTVGALVVGGFAKRLIDKRRERALNELDESAHRESADTEQDEQGSNGLEEAEGHPS